MIYDLDIVCSNIFCVMFVRAHILPQLRGGPGHEGMKRIKEVIYKKLEVIYLLWEPYA